MQPLLTHRQWAPPAVPRELDYSHPPFSQYLPPRQGQHTADPHGPDTTNPCPLPPATSFAQLQSQTPAPVYLPSNAQYGSENSSKQSGSDHSPWLLTPQYAFFPTTTTSPNTAYPPHLQYGRQDSQIPYQPYQPYIWPTPTLTTGHPPINTQPSNATANHADVSTPETETYVYNNYPLVPTPTHHFSSLSWPKTIFYNTDQNNDHHHEATQLYNVDLGSESKPNPVPSGEGYNTHAQTHVHAPLFPFAPPLHPGTINLDQPLPNSITIPSEIDHPHPHQHPARIFRSETIASVEPSSTIDPSRLSTFDQSTELGGAPRDPCPSSNLERGTMTGSDRAPSSNLISSSGPATAAFTSVSPHPDAAGAGAKINNPRIQQHSHVAPTPATTHITTSEGGRGEKPPISKRGRRSSTSRSLSSSSRTTPLRKKRPPKLHLPPPTSNMHLPIPPPLRSAPAAAFSLDVLMPANGRPNGALPLVLPQQPPKVDGWVSPEERPVPPLGYVPTTLEPSQLQMDQQAAPSSDQPMSSIDSTLPPHWPHAPETVPRLMPDPRIRVPNIPEYPPPPPYLVAPGLNGFEIIPWRATPRPIPAPLHLVQSNHIFPHIQTAPLPATAAPWDLSAPPAEIPLPPPTASSCGSSDSWSDMVPTSMTMPSSSEGAMSSQQSQPAYHPVLRRDTSCTSARSGFVSIENRQQTICEVCHTGLSRQSDLVRHMRKHTGEKPFQCPHCGDAYARKDKLSNHILRVHSGKSKSK